MRVYFSWLAAHSGSSLPLTKAEVEYVRAAGCDLVLTGSTEHAAFAQREHGLRAVFLPLTAFVETDVFKPTIEEISYDIAFICGFDLETIVRKRGVLFLQTLSAIGKPLRVVWMGGTAISERISDENELRDLVDSQAPQLSATEGLLWDPIVLRRSFEQPSSRYVSEKQRSTLVGYLEEEARRRGVRIEFRQNLRRAEVAQALRSSALSVVLGRRDNAPRAIIESLACGCPVVAASDLIAGLEFVTGDAGRVVEPSVCDLRKAIEGMLGQSRGAGGMKAGLGDGWGFERCIEKIVTELSGDDWDSVVSIPRPWEVAMYKELHSNCQDMRK